jgi:hypothetical protein
VLKNVSERELDLLEEEVSPECKVAENPQVNIFIHIFSH